MIKTKIAERLLLLPRRTKRIFAVSVDTLLCLWTVWAALYLRLEQWVPLVDNHWLALVAAPLIAIPIFVRCGLYRAIFRHTGWPVMLALVRASLIYGAIYSLFFTFVSVPGVPRAIGIIQPIILFLVIAASRAAAHSLLGGNYKKLLAEEGSPKVIIYGAGSSGRQLAAAVAESRKMELVGFVDDDASLQGASLNGLMIHPPSRVSALVSRHGVTDILLAIPSASRQRRGEVYDLIRGCGVKVRTLPGLLDLAQGRFEVSELRAIEIEDLLGREAVPPKRDLLERNIVGKVVLVTGGGGSIGSELCRQILALGPSALLVVDASEYALYRIHRELEAAGSEAEPRPKVIPLLASTLDEQRMRRIFSVWAPQTVYHAAAYKHVPLVEHNVIEGIRNNAFGTLILGRLAQEFAVESFVLISTDKAVRPTNVMGASKRLAEMILQSLASAGSATRISIVRFGNVLGSSGSVVPLFREQISNGGPVTVTHREVTRYFMTIPEAGGLVLQAGAMGEGGEVFVLDMGEPVRIYDLATNMIALSGMTARAEGSEDGDIEIEVVGLRPGEKLYEELLIGGEPLPTDHERIMRVREEFPSRRELDGYLDALKGAMDGSSVEAVLDALHAAVPEFERKAVVDWTDGPPRHGQIHDLSQSQRSDGDATAAAGTGGRRARPSVAHARQGL